MFLRNKLIYIVSLLALMGCSINTTAELLLDSWMKHLPPSIKDMPLTDIAIPGSHDSMTYNILYGVSTVGPDADTSLKVIDVFFKATPIMWARTQGLYTMKQLLAGIRFLDLRLATATWSDKFYFTHGYYAGEITEPLNQVKEFVDSHPEEVVILYFQHFYEFTEEHHKRVIKFLVDLFGPRLVPQPVSILNITINNLAKLNQSIIIVYRNNAVVSNSQLWYPNMLESPWPQKQSTEELLKYFQYTIRPPRMLFVHQAVLTPSGSFIMSRLFSSLREACAKPVLHDVLPVLANDFSPGPVKDMNTQPAPINVVIADFIELENNLFPRTIIALNDKLIHPTN